MENILTDIKCNMRINLPIEKPAIYDIIDATTIPDSVGSINAQDVLDILTHPALNRYMISAYNGKFFFQHNWNGNIGVTLIQLERNENIEMNYFIDTFSVLNHNVHGEFIKVLDMALIANYIMKKSPIMIETTYSSSIGQIHNVSEYNSPFRFIPRDERDTPVHRVIRIKMNEAPTMENHNHHNIACPCWGVIGHFRTCKSGKQVWVKPHLRGTMKDHPEELLYIQKNYKL